MHFIYFAQVAVLPPYLEWNASLHAQKNAQNQSVITGSRGRRMVGMDCKSLICGRRAYRVDALKGHEYACNYLFIIIMMHCQNQMASKKKNTLAKYGRHFIADDNNLQSSKSVGKATRRLLPSFYLPQTRCQIKNRRLQKNCTLRLRYTRSAIRNRHRVALIVLSKT